MLLVGSRGEISRMAQITAVTLDMLLEGLNAHLKGEIEDLKDQRTQLRADIEAWRSAAMQKRLTWRGLFGGGKAE